LDVVVFADAMAVLMVVWVILDRPPHKFVSIVVVVVVAAAEFVFSAADVVVVSSSSSSSSDTCNSYLRHL
jgi:hypothetical protein